MKKTLSKTILALLLLITLSLSACNGSYMPFRPDTKTTSFYEGSEGVFMRFSDMSSPPTKMYYYEDEYGVPYDDDNTFNIFVDVHNKGASWTRGGLYVSGYDPNMVTIEEIDIPRLGAWGGCGLTVGSVAEQGEDFWSNVGFMMDCPGMGGAYRYDQDTWGFNIQNIGNAISQVSGQDYTDEWWSNVGVAYDNQNMLAGGSSTGVFHMDLGPVFNFDYMNHGKGLLVLLAGINFVRYNGQEYLLAPDDYDYPGGEMTTVSFTGHINNWPKGLDKTEHGMPFLVTNCYAYTTYAAPQVCIDPEPYSEGKKVCYPKEITYNGGNGAPVAITSIEQENTRRRIYFDINIKNIGNGQIFDMLQMEFCSPYYPGRLGAQHFNKVYMVDVRIGDQHLYCTPSRGEGVRLNDRGEGKVRCTYDMEFVGSRSAYETPLIIEVAYGYTDTMQRRTMIKRVI